MPLKDPEARRAYMREWYARPENRRRTIEKVAKRKKTKYAGVCRNCGGPTVGRSKDDAPQYCGKPECRSAQRIGQWAGKGESYDPSVRRIYVPEKGKSIREVAAEGGSASE